MDYQVTPDFYADLLAHPNGQTGNYIIENDNGFPWTAVKAKDGLIKAQDFNSQNEATSWLELTLENPATPTADQQYLNPEPTLGDEPLN